MDRGGPQSPESFLPLSCAFPAHPAENRFCRGVLLSLPPLFDLETMETVAARTSFPDTNEAAREVPRGFTRARMERLDSLRASQTFLPINHVAIFVSLAGLRWGGRFSISNQPPGEPVDHPARPEGLISARTSTPWPQPPVPQPSCCSSPQGRCWIPISLPPHPAAPCTEWSSQPGYQSCPKGTQT